jgi:HSP20 family molecular chaperone IbpA
MMTTNLDSCAMLGPDFLSASSNEPRRLLQALFVELAHYLETLNNSPSITADGESLDRCDDENFTYLEADLPGISESEIDINIHDGRVYIRMGR